NIISASGRACPTADLRSRQSSRAVPRGWRRHERVPRTDVRVRQQTCARGLAAGTRGLRNKLTQDCYRSIRRRLQCRPAAGARRRQRLRAARLRPSVTTSEAEERKLKREKEDDDRPGGVPDSAGLVLRHEAIETAAVRAAATVLAAAPRPSGIGTANACSFQHQGACDELNIEFEELLKDDPMILDKASSRAGEPAS
ncbi:hypothetical protein U9M48_030070, partial [Paspalum notatum var. saurae]